MPPLYTNNKLVAAPSFEPRADDPRVLAGEVSNRRVNRTRACAADAQGHRLQGAVAAGLWYRGLYGHDGWFTSLEDWFD